MFDAAFNFEEGNAFYVPTFFHGPELLLEPWGGSLQAIPRLGYAVLGFLPPLMAPLAENLLSYAIVVGTAAYVAGPRLAPVVPDQRLRLLLGASLLLMTGQQDILGFLVNAHWYLGLWMVVLVVTTDPLTGIGRWAERAFLLLAALSGPISILLTPLFWIRALRNPLSVSAHSQWLAVIVTLAAGAQLFVLLTAGRQDGGGTNLPAALLTAGTHGIATPLLGERITGYSSPLRPRWSGLS